MSSKSSNNTTKSSTTKSTIAANAATARANAAAFDVCFRDAIAAATIASIADSDPKANTPVTNRRNKKEKDDQLAQTMLSDDSELSDIVCVGVTLAVA
jgi:hypothetical protein